MAGAARRVWEELYVCKKPAIEEVFKITLVLPVGNARAPDLGAVREQLSEGAHKLWINYIDTERKVSYNHTCVHLIVSINPDNVINNKQFRCLVYRLGRNYLLFICRFADNRSRIALVSIIFLQNKLDLLFNVHLFLLYFYRTIYCCIRI